MGLLWDQGSPELQANQDKARRSQDRGNQVSQDNQVGQTDCQANQDQVVQVKGNRDNQGDQGSLCPLHHLGKDNQVSQAFQVRDHLANQDLRNLDKGSQASQDKAPLDQVNQEDPAGSHVLKKDSSGILTAAIGFTAALTLGTVLWHMNLTVPKVSYSMSGTVPATGPMPHHLATKGRRSACLLLVVAEDLSLVPDSLRHVLPDHRRRRHPLECHLSHRHRSQAHLKHQASQRAAPFRGLLAP